MMFSCKRTSCCVTLTLGILIGLGGRANAASIVQSVDYHGAEYGTMLPAYNQFDPSLGTLMDVIIQCQGSSSYSQYFEFTNNSNVAQTFTGTVSYTEITDGGSTVFSNTFKDTLGPGQFEYAGAQGVTTCRYRTEIIHSGWGQGFWSHSNMPQLPELPQDCPFRSVRWPNLITQMSRLARTNFRSLASMTTAQRLSPTSMCLLGLFRSRRRTCCWERPVSYSWQLVIASATGP